MDINVTKHGATRMRQRSSLSDDQLKEVIETKAYEHLGKSFDRNYCLVYDAQSKKFVIVCLSDDGAIVTVLESWHDIPGVVHKRISSVTKTRAMQRFYAKLATRPHWDLDNGILTLVCILHDAKSLQQIARATALQVSSDGFDLVSSRDVAEICADTFVQLIKSEQAKDPALRDLFYGIVQMQRKDGSVARQVRLTAKDITLADVSQRIVGATLTISRFDEQVSTKLGIITLKSATLRTKHAIVKLFPDTLKAIHDAMTAEMSGYTLSKSSYRISFVHEITEETLRTVLYSHGQLGMFLKNPCKRRAEV